MESQQAVEMRNAAAPGAADEHAQSGLPQPSPDGQRRRAGTWAVALSLLAIAGACLTAYSDSFKGPFIFDDLTWIVSNRSIRGLWPLGRVVFPPATVVTQGRPLLNLTLAINYALGGINVEGYHAFNLIIHVLTAWALFAIVRRTLLLPLLRGRFGPAATWLALAIALIWAVHPITTAAVTYITQRNESLVALFYLLTLYGTIRGATADGQTRALLWYIAAVFACLLGMFTKEVMITAPLVVLLYDRTFLAGSFARAIRVRRSLYISMLTTTAALVWCLVSSDFHSGTAGLGVERFTPLSYLLTESGVIAHYLGQSFWPNGLCLDYDWPPATSVGEIVPAGLLVASLLALACWALVKHPAAGFLAACFFLILAPTSSFVPIDDAAFDHRMYLPLAAIATGVVMGLDIVAGWFFSRRSGDRRHSRQIAVGVVCGLTTVVAAVLGWKTYTRNETFQSAESIWKDAVEKRPLNARALNNAGEQVAMPAETDDAAQRRHRIEEAIAFYKRSMAADPRYIPPINNLAGIKRREGDLSAALQLFQRALTIQPEKPDHRWVRINLASLLSQLGKLDEAAAQCQRALDRQPDFAEGLVVLAEIRLRQGRPDEAIRLCETALEINPDLIEGHAKLAAVLEGVHRGPEAIVHLRRLTDLQPEDAGVAVRLAMGLAAEHRTEEAAAEYVRAVSLAPNDWTIRVNYANLLGEQGKWRAAIGQWRAAAAIKPDARDATLRLAWALATCPDGSLRNGREALEIAERQIERGSGSDPRALDTLAAARAELGEFREAAALAEKAMNLATQRNEQALAAQIAERLGFYLTGKPYREPIRKDR